MRKTKLQKGLTALLLAGLLTGLCGCGQTQIPQSSQNQAPELIGPEFYLDFSSMEEGEQAPESDQVIEEDWDENSALELVQEFLPDNGIYSSETLKHWPVAYDSMETSLFHEEVLEQAIASMEALLEAPYDEASTQEVINQYNLMVWQIDALVSEYALTDIRTYLDPTDEQAADHLEELVALDVDYENQVGSLLCSLFAGDYGPVFREALGEERCDLYADFQEDTDEQKELFKEEEALIRRYNELTSGEEMPDYETKEKVRQIYLDMVANRTAQAKSYGYDDYSAYANECIYYRDYSKEDIQSLQNTAKNELLPFQVKFLNRAQEQGVFELYNAGAYSTKEMISMVDPYLESLSGDLLEAWNFFKDQHLYNMEVDEKRVDAGFTTSIPYYGSCFIFDSQTGVVTDLTTLVHEFGHFRSMYETMSASMYNISNMDVSEIHSQGLEVLLCDKYQDMVPGYGKDLAEYTLLSLNDAVLSALAIDEIETKIYENPDMTWKQISDLADQVGWSYGVGELVNGENWIQIPHVFISPKYYLSYGTSAMAALDLYAMANKDYRTAADCYIRLSDMGCDTPFCRTLETCGLSDVFDPEFMSIVIGVERRNFSIS